MTVNNMDSESDCLSLKTISLSHVWLRKVSEPLFPHL